MLLGGDARPQPDQRVLLGARTRTSSCCCRDLCIGSRDEVVSVVLVSARAARRARRRAHRRDEESASGRNLLRILLERRYGVARDVRRRDRTARAGAARRAGAADRRLARSTRSTFPPRARVRSRQAVARVDADCKRCSRFGRRGATRTSAIPRRGRRRACTPSTDACTWSRSHHATVVARGASARSRAGGLLRKLLRQVELHVPRRGAATASRAFCRELRRDRCDSARCPPRFRRPPCPSLASLLDRAAGGGRLTSTRACASTTRPRFTNWAPRRTRAAWRCTRATS